MNKHQSLLTHFASLKENVDLSQLTTIKIGGPAELFLDLKDPTELPTITKECDIAGIPWIIIGGGSNIVFSESGFQGLVIRMTAKKTTLIKENIIEAQAGVLLSQLIQFTLKNNLKGLENLAGLPGTLGGAIRGNAGAHGTEIKDILKSITVFDTEKGLLTKKTDYFNFSYRDSDIKRTPRLIVVSALLKLQKASPKELTAMNETIKNSIVGRVGRQPQGKTTGSFFKNPSSEQFAGKLLDLAGCKGLRVGDAQISDLHANWIINLGNATQNDIIQLAKMAQNKVKERFDVALTPEVQLIGTTGFIDI